MKKKAVLFILCFLGCMVYGQEGVNGWEDSLADVDAPDEPGGEPDVLKFLPPVGDSSMLRW